MTKSTRRLVAVHAVSLMAFGCGMLGSLPPPIEDDVVTRNEWKKVIQVSEQGGITVRKHVGYFNRRYTEADPGGITFVLDARRTRVGFVLPTGQAYAYEIERQTVANKRDLGNFGFDNGVKTVLGLAGTTLEYESVTETGGSSVVPGTGNS